MLPFTVDGLSIWIQNKQLFEQFDAEQLDVLQNDIINNVFNGFKSLLQLLLKNNNNIMTVSQHHKLHELLSNNYDEDIFNEYRIQNKHSEDNKLCIIDLPDDCLSYTFKFLTNNERYTIQQCCRLFTITSRQESSVNNIEKDLPFMRITPYKRIMIQGFLSNDDIKIMQSFHIYLKYIDLQSRNGDIEHFSNELFKTFKQLLIKKKLEPTVMSVIAGLEYNLVSFGALSLVPDILNKIVENAKIGNLNGSNCDGTPFRNIIYGINCAIDWRNQVDEVAKCKGLIPALYNALTCFNLFNYKHEWHKEDAFSNGCEVLTEILKFGYDSHRKILIDNGIIDELYKIANIMDRDEFYSCDVYKVLEYYLIKATSKEIDLLLKHDIMKKIFNKNDNYIRHGVKRFILKLLKLSNHPQRMICIEKIIECYKSVTDGFRMEIFKILKSVNDLEAENKLKVYGDIHIPTRYSSDDGLSELDDW